MPPKFTPTRLLALQLGVRTRPTRIPVIVACTNNFKGAGTVEGTCGDWVWLAITGPCLKLGTLMTVDFVMRSTQGMPSETGRVRYDEEGRGEVGGARQSAQSGRRCKIDRWRQKREVNRARSRRGLGELGKFTQGTIVWYIQNSTKHQARETGWMRSAIWYSDLLLPGQDDLIDAQGVEEKVLRWF
ncbi:hypothetical protein DFP72DRAFT_856603 [Ephemerocybe angulata]|uniref:Uncharacterized protein n=1 Tax=Ephemerocybe angulata TaxID=980116 RepID=A0A8H6LUX6_9AGAR|nr:hypothetical protein DFP72DRAFT_858699 [Tulosesus angulatus]KAF6745341.1 hypothetical protein DFP72DRAFT_856603 [Tulosesus angulatus]